jgi:hypothetical protein
VSRRQKSIGILVLALILGAIIGSALGEALARVLPSGVVRDFLLRSVTASIGPTTLDLVVFTLTLGFSIDVNVMAVVGIVLATYLFRWY